MKQFKSPILTTTTSGGFTQKRAEHDNAIHKYCTKPFSEVPLSVNKKVTPVYPENLNTRGQLKGTQI